MIMRWRNTFAICGGEDVSSCVLLCSGILVGHVSSRCAGVTILVQQLNTNIAHNPSDVDTSGDFWKIRRQ